MDRSTPAGSETDRSEAVRLERDGDPTAAPATSASEPGGESAAEPGADARFDPSRDAVAPADRTAFRIGANLLTLLALVLGGWWLWRHLLGPALLGSP